MSCFISTTNRCKVTSKIQAHFPPLPTLLPTLLPTHILETVHSSFESQNHCIYAKITHPLLVVLLVSPTLTKIEDYFCGRGPYVDPRKTLPGLYEDGPLLSGRISIRPQVTTPRELGQTGHRTPS